MSASKIFNFSERLQMKDGIFRKVIPTIREGKEYPISDLNPQIDQNTTQKSNLWVDVEKSFVLSQKSENFSISKIQEICKKLEDYSATIEQTIREVESDLADHLKEFFNQAKDPFKADITGIKIEGFQNGKLFGVIGLDRALPKNNEDLNNPTAFTVPYQEKEEEKEDWEGVV